MSDGPRMTRNQRAVLAILPTTEEEALDTHSVAVKLTEAQSSAAFGHNPYSYDATFSILNQLHKTGAVERIGRPAAWHRTIEVEEEDRGS